MNEGRVAPKFSTKLIKIAPPCYLQLAELKYWCAEFNRLGLTPAQGEGALGNLSFRVKPGSAKFVITATRFGPKDLDDPRGFVEVLEVDFEQMLVTAAGEREPSSESMLHYAIYKQRPEINAIFHGHSAEIMRREGFPCTAKEESYGSIALVNSVLPLTATHNFVIMNNHGFLSLGKTLNEAGARVA